MVKTQPGEVGREPRRRCGDPEVGGEGEPAPAAHGCSLDRRHHGQRGDEEPQRLGVELGDVLSCVGTEVESGTEVLALGGQDDGPAPTGGVQLLVGRGDPGHHRGVEIVVGWTVQADHGHVVALALDGDVGARAHAGSSTRLRQ